MHLQLDAQRMRAAMDLWRHELDAQPNAEALARLGATLGGWLDLLRLCTPQRSEHDELHAIVSEATQLREWANEAAAALRLIEQIPSVASPSRPAG